MYVMSRSIHNKIASVCLNLYKKLPKTGKPSSTEWTVLSCIVRQIGDSDFEVVALGTGLKCIGKDFMSKEGDVLNDSHAEVVCRRAFLKYLYQEIDLASENQSEIVELVSGKFLLKADVLFHFFTTHVPCGDASIFAKQSTEQVGNCLQSEGNSDVEQTATTSDFYRTGAKCLPDEQKRDLYLDGPSYHTVGAIRTKPGRGNPTLSVSCSDKLSRWMHIGIQGALLSFFIEKPILFSSFTIVKNTPFNEAAFRRALYLRFEEGLNVAAICVHVMIGQSEQHFDSVKSESKTTPCPSSIIWSKTNTLPLEVAVNGKKQGVTKKDKNSPNSRLQISKVELFRMFTSLIEKRKVELHESLYSSSPSTYYHVKQKSKVYQQAWITLKETKFKIWTTKDYNLTRFYLG